ncbi:hypothetical protein [Candidatus Oleimmundimicrobium sp.]|uniref:hypothetical protein n=1 Tax=Candidatus Oleimmundimicrobium sp. TaxID=3060597 RepID=UPI002715F0FB|nr:hypothetical protein [Candidatus Oleimmundimicrobium sp.]MDO8886462.1 hypothetical protein [Candidatus Oleimmundimicrobium sp.]
MKKILALLTIFALLISLVLVVGCAKKTTTIKTEEGDVKIESEIDGEKTTIETEEGKVEIGTGSKIPDDWPSDMPVYPSAEIQGSWNMTGEAGAENIAVVLITQDSIDQVKDYYKQKLPANGWTIEDSGTFSSAEGTFGGFTITKGSRNGNVTFGTSDEGITITIGVYNE